MTGSIIPDSGTEGFGSLLTSGGAVLAGDPGSLGRLTDSLADFGDTGVLRARMARDGYLFLPGALDRAAVLRARAEVTRRPAVAGVLARGTDPMDALAATPTRAVDRAARAALTQDNGFCCKWQNGRNGVKRW